MTKRSILSYLHRVIRGSAPAPPKFFQAWLRRATLRFKVPGAKNETDAVKPESKSPELAVIDFSEFGFFVAQHQKRLTAARGTQPKRGRKNRGGKASLGSNLVFGFQPNYKPPRGRLNRSEAA